MRGASHARLTPALAAGLGVGMLYQDPLDFPALPVWENFRLGGTARTRGQVVDKLGELSNHLGVCFLPDEPIASLTVGERQLLELLRLLDLGATTLILDEPTTGITPEQKRSLFGLLARLAREENHTVVLVTHSACEALEMADAIFVMRQGRLVATLETPCGEDELVRLMFGEVSGPCRGRPAQSPPGGRRAVLDGAVFAGPKYHLGPLHTAAAPGEMIGLAGLDGSGQELFLRGLCGLDRLYRGTPRPRRAGVRTQRLQDPAQGRRALRPGRPHESGPLPGPVHPRAHPPGLPDQPVAWRTSGGSSAKGASTSSPTPTPRPNRSRAATSSACSCP